MTETKQGANARGKELSDQHQELVAKGTKQVGLTEVLRVYGRFAPYSSTPTVSQPITVAPMSSDRRNLRRHGASLRVNGVACGLTNFRIDQQPPDPAGQVAFEAAQGFAPRLPLGLLSLEELPRRRVDASLTDGDPVKGAVELSVAAAVETMADALA